MSLALWEFFWDWGGTPAPSPSPSPSPTPAPGPTQPPAPLPDTPPGGSGSGGGKGKGHGKGHKEPQLLASPEDLWDIRERYLRSLHPPEITPAPRPNQSASERVDELASDYISEANRVYTERAAQIEQLNADRSELLIAMQGASDLKTMKKLGVQLKELNAKIATLTHKQAFARFMR